MALAESAWNVNTGNRESLSKQQFVDCDSSRSECNEDVVNDSAFPQRLQVAQAASSGKFLSLQTRPASSRPSQCITTAKALSEGFGSEETSTVLSARWKRET